MLAYNESDLFTIRTNIYIQQNNNMAMYLLFMLFDTVSLHTKRAKLNLGYCNCNHMAEENNLLFSPYKNLWIIDIRLCKGMIREKMRL